MKQGNPITLKSPIQDRLSQLAHETNRSDDELANEALEQYLDYQEWVIAEIQTGIADADAGRTASHEQVKAWVESLGTDQEFTAPQPPSV